MLKTTIPYVKRDQLYGSEKSYRVDFPLTAEEIRNGAKLTNNILDHRLVQVRRIEDLQKFTLDSQGFCIIKATTLLSAEEALTKSESVRESYYAQIENLLLQKFPEYRRIECFEFVVSRLSLPCSHAVDLATHLD